MSPAKKGTIFQGNNEQKKTVRAGKELKKIDKLIKGSQKKLFKVKAVFPFNFFTDELIIDAAKLSIVKRFFFFSASVRSVAYEDIFQVSVSYSVLFATLSVADRFYQQAPSRVSYLWKQDALKARRLIQGLMIARQENILLEDLPEDVVLKKVEELGRSRENNV